MSETLSNNYLISQFISSAELYKSQYLSLLEKLVSSLVTEEDKIAILTELGSVEIFSNNFLNKKILNLENLFTSILNGQSVIGPDGIGRKFESVDNLSSKISVENRILYSASRKFLDLFVTLKLPINIGKSENANIRLYKFDFVNSTINLVPEFIDEFYSVIESEFLRDCSINNVNVSLFDFNENGMSKKPNVSGDFDIFRIKYNNLNNIKIELNSLYCNEPSRNLLSSRILKKDDLLITKNGTTCFRIKEVLTVDNSILVELISGGGKISQLDKLYVKFETDNEIQISVLPNEKLILFIRTDGSVEEPKSKFVNVSNSVIYDSVGNIVNPNSLNDLERVFNYFKGLFLERRISLFSGVVPNVPILQNRNFRIVRLNAHRINQTWKISGFWEIPASIQNQNVVAFKVQYRYLGLNEDFPVESNSQEILLNGISTIGSTSNWNEIQTTTRRKILINGIWVWEPSNESDSNIRSFNSIELLIENREKIQIRVKSLSEVGFDTNNSFESEWSNIIEMKLDENILLTSEVLVNRISAIENEITNIENLEISINSSSRNQQLNWNVENVIELENYSNFLNSNTNLRNGDFNISNFQLKIKNTSLNAVVLRSRDFAFVGNVKSSNSVDLTFDSLDREYNEFLKYDLFSFDDLVQRKNQILRLRGSSLLGDNLNINLNSGSNILKTCDYTLLDTLIRNNNGNVYTPTGNVYLNDILSLNLSNWFYISKDSINHNISQNLSFSQNKLISVSNLSLKNEFDENLDKYLIGPLSNGISVKLSTDLSKISTDLYGNFKLESNQEIIIDIKIKSRFLDYLGNSYKEEYIKTIGLDIYLKDLTKKSIDLKFKQK